MQKEGGSGSRRVEDTPSAWTGAGGSPLAQRTATEDSTIEAAAQAYGAGDFARACSIAGNRLHTHPHDAEARHLRGIAAYRLGRFQDAARDLEAAIQAQPKRPDWRWNLTAILRSLGRLKEAEAQGREAVRLAPDAPEARNNLGTVLRELGFHAEAEGHYRRAVALRPTYADAWSNLAWALSVAGNASQAAEAARRALALNPNDANAHNNLGTALMQQDQLREAGECFERAVALKPDFTMAHSNLLFCLNYRPDLAAKEIFAAYRQWNEAHAQALLPAAPHFANDRNPERRLRVGYVSPDFRHHAASFFMEPMLAAHDHAKFEVVCYGEVANPDATTARFKRIADRWQSTVGLSDAAVADLVRSDGIDILVDLAGHTAGNRLLVFARKPAPVQVAHMVGSGMTTGIGAIDAFLADGELVPEGSEHLFAERVERLSCIPLVYAPPAAMPEVRKLPALRKGHVTFGCFSRTARINERVVEAWARILKGVPGARLVLNSKPLREVEGRAHWHGRFQAHGVAPDRIDLVYTSPQPKTWEAYAEIDIALDPFPHNAGTTTIEALWMGVPVVSLADRPPVGRFGASILGSVGLRDWVAGSVDHYVALAIGAASDRQALARLRAALRDRFRASPLGGDAAALTREIEGVYRRLWRSYCGQG